MIKVNLKKLKPYGDRLDDGVVQLSFTLPVSASPEAKEAAKRYVEKMGLERVFIAAMEPMGRDFSYFVVYGHSKESIDFTKIHVPKIEMPEMDYAGLKEYMAAHIEKPIVVIGAATGSDAHTVGIDAIMNMKGFAGDYGLERYPLFKTYNLRSQLTNEQLIDKAVELGADAMLVSQIVTQRDSHMKNLKELEELVKKDKRLSRSMITIVGGPRLDHSIGLKLGFDAGFGTGTKPSQVANFIVREYMKRRGIKERVKDAPHAHSRTEEIKTHHEVEVPAAEEQTKVEGAAVEQAGGVHRKRRRRGRRGGRRHRRKHEHEAGGKKPEAGGKKPEAGSGD